MKVEEFWIKAKEHFLEMNDIEKQGEALKTSKKMFAMYNKGNFIVKLSKERVKELIISGEGLPYDPGNGKIMKEWVIIHEKYINRWIEYASEAKKFAKILVK